MFPDYLQMAGNKTVYRINKGMIWWAPEYRIDQVAPS